MDDPEVKARRERPERRSDQMSIRMKPSTRTRIEELAEAEGVPIAEIVERAIGEQIERMIAEIEQDQARGAASAYGGAGAVIAALCLCALWALWEIMT